jgi:UDP-sulfoquinovose synthase
MRILVLGGDGYLGWPTTMHLSAHGHEVAVADNYLRRRLCREENIDLLFEVPDLPERTAIWQSVSGHHINVHIGDLNEWDFVANVFEKFSPQAVIHYAEQPAAP